MRGLADGARILHDKIANLQLGLGHQVLTLCEAAASELPTLKTEPEEGVDGVDKASPLALPLPISPPPTPTPTPIPTAAPAVTVGVAGWEEAEEEDPPRLAAADLV